MRGLWAGSELRVRTVKRLLARSFIFTGSPDRAGCLFSPVVQTAAQRVSRVTALQARTRESFFIGLL
jgi:hypothetical protein